MTYSHYRGRRPGFQPRQISQFVNDLAQRIRESIKSRDSTPVVQCVDTIIAAGDKDARSLVGNTSISSYRRLHEIVAGALDYCTASRDLGDKSELLFRLARAKVMVSYQRSRDQISPGIESVLLALIDSLKEAVSDGERKHQAEACRHARLVLDAIAVLIYRFGRKG